MGHEPAEMIEHVQHDSHHAHDGFDKLVAISVAILAAGLAYVTILSHQMHNDVVMKQLEAGLSKNEATNRWSQFQATNIRSHNLENEIDKAESESTPNSEKRTALVEKWRKKVKAYETEKLPEVKKTAEAAEQLTVDKMAASVHSHHKAEQIDLGELALQFAVVLASLAILTKRRSFWYAGIACGLAGFLWAMAGYFEIGLPQAIYHAPVAAEHPNGEIKPDAHGEKIH
jgi:hypothetical protein